MATEVDNILKPNLNGLPIMQLFVWPYVWDVDRFKSIHPASTVSLCCLLACKNVHGYNCECLANIPQQMGSIVSAKALEVSFHSKSRAVIAKTAHQISSHFITCTDCESCLTDVVHQTSALIDLEIQAVHLFHVVVLRSYIKVTFQSPHPALKDCIRVLLHLLDVPMTPMLFCRSCCTWYLLVPQLRFRNFVNSRLAVSLELLWKSLVGTFVICKTFFFITFSMFLSRFLWWIFSFPFFKRLRTWVKLSFHRYWNSSPRSSWSCRRSTAMYPREMQRTVTMITATKNQSTVSIKIRLGVVAVTGLRLKALISMTFTSAFASCAVIPARVNRLIPLRVTVSCSVLSFTSEPTYWEVFGS